MRRQSSYLSVILTMLIVYFLFRSGIISFLLLVIFMVIAFIAVGYLVYSVFKGVKKDNINKPQTNHEQPIANKLQDYFSKNKILPISNNASLIINNLLYSNISDLCLAYKDEKFIKLSAVKEDNYLLYERIVKKLEVYSKLNSNQLMELAKDIKYSSYHPIEFNEIDINSIKGSMVNKPEVNELSIKDSYKQYLLAMINNVNYGDDNSKEYVSGHYKALKKYFEEINKSDNILALEKDLDNEMHNIKDKTSIFDKGYYDGLFYVIKTIKIAKKNYLEMLDKEIEE